jgi:hypothetical protein
MHKRRRHTCHPIEVLALKLPEIAPSRCACLPEFNKNSILIAPNRRKASLNQQVRSSGRLKWAAYVIAKVHDLANAEGSQVRKNSLKSEKIPMYIRDCSKFHLALPIAVGNLLIRLLSNVLAGQPYSSVSVQCMFFISR